MRREPDPYESAGDEELIRRSVEGDEAAFEALIRRKRERVFWIAYRIVGHEEDAKEVAQATFIRLWKVLPRFRPGLSFETWLYRITVNLAIDQYRSRGPFRESGPLPEEGLPAESSPGSASLGDPGTALVAAELRVIFEKLASRLGEKQRAVFVLSQIEGMPTEEIARILEIAPSTVRNHLLQARRTLREGMRRFYPEYYRAARGSEPD